MLPKAHRYRFGAYRLDVRRRVLEGELGPVELQPKVMELLLYLLQRPDEAVTKDELLSAVWDGTVVTESALTRAVRALRRALGDEAAEPRYLVALRGVGYRFLAAVEVEREPPAGSPPRTLAVFPFRALSPATRDETLQRGIPDTLVARLSRLPDLVVRSLSSAEACLAAESDPPSAARALGVDHFLEGALQASAGRLRVNARLVRVADERCLWSGSFDEPLAEIFSLQDALGERVLPLVSAHVRASGTDSASRAIAPAAYRAYLEGRAFAARHAAADLERARSAYERALDEAPGFAEAWAALGECHELVATEGGPSAPDEYELARRAARRALALAPALAEAEGLTAKIEWQHDWNWQAAEQRFRRALDGSPQNGALHTSYSDFLCLQGRTSEGVVHARRALEVDPVSPWCGALLAQALYMDGRSNEALAQAERTLELAPGFAFASFFAGLACMQAGRSDEALAYFDAAGTAGRADFGAVRALCVQRLGRSADADELHARFEADSGTPPFALALAGAATGRVDDMRAALERCVEQRDWHLLLLFTDPLLEPLGALSDLRWIEQRLGLGR